MLLACEYNMDTFTSTTFPDLSSLASSLTLAAEVVPSSDAGSEVSFAASSFSLGADRPSVRWSSRQVKRWCVHHEHCFSYWHRGTCSRGIECPFFHHCTRSTSSAYCSVYRPDLRTNVMAFDCEMMTADRYTSSGRSIMGRVSVVNVFGEVVLDTFAYPTDCFVRDTNFRYGSGIRREDIRPQAGAVSYDSARAKFLELADGCRMIGFSLHSDVKVLRLKSTDTSAHFVDVQKHIGYAIPGKQQPSLRELSHLYLRRRIQAGSHSSVEDALATIDLYKRRRTFIDIDFALPYVCFAYLALPRVLSDPV